MHKAFDQKQAVIDIEYQLSRTMIHNKEAKEVLWTDIKMLPE
jgi:hypothetical protein